MYDGVRRFYLPWPAGKRRALQVTRASNCQQVGALLVSSSVSQSTMVTFFAVHQSAGDSSHDQEPAGGVAAAVAIRTVSPQRSRQPQQQCTPAIEQLSSTSDTVITLSQTTAIIPLQQQSQKTVDTAAACMLSTALLRREHGNLRQCPQLEHGNLRQCPQLEHTS